MAIILFSSYSCQISWNSQITVCQDFNDADTGSSLTFFKPLLYFLEQLSTQISYLKFPCFPFSTYAVREPTQVTYLYIGVVVALSYFGGGIFWNVCITANFMAVIKGYLFREVGKQVRILNQGSTAIVLMSFLPVK